MKLSSERPMKVFQLLLSGQEVKLAWQAIFLRLGIPFILDQRHSGHVITVPMQ